ncbi:hypothetical protein Egran_04545 [Elaphomyces granulatus]|uniref:mRNA cap guanine-N(7) methyltransferase n=1 Tax=Elaphomyces granulatus TaxID=519963 RepID=A0A232LU52_9EURO|nr:hypothetical protein Egran_04545 [Elaphomyces granulatus]
MGNNTEQSEPTAREVRRQADTADVDSRTKIRNPNISPNEKKRKLVEDEDKAKPTPDQPLSKRKRQEERHQKLRKRGKATPSVYSRRDSRSPTNRAPGDQSSLSPKRSRDPTRNRSASPFPLQRSPTPEAQAQQRKRPGGGARLAIADREALKRRQAERERAQQEEVERALRERGVSDVVRQHYNAVPQREREWRKTDSKIKGLRSFNNWIKSTLIQKFSPDEEFLSKITGGKEWVDGGGSAPVDEKKLLVVDLGCGKGGDLGKWQLAPQPVDLYVGLDPAEVSVEQARERYNAMKSGRGQRGRRSTNTFHAEFQTKDCFGEWLGDVPIIQQVGIDANVGPDGSAMSSRWGGGGFDVVATMFAMHYAFESEKKARQMLHNVAGALKKGGRFLGVCPNSDVISAKVVEFHQKRKLQEEAARNGDVDPPEDGEVEEDSQSLEWGNSIYRVRFPSATPEDGIFRPPFAWKYSYFMEEAVEEIPEYVVPWEAFRALTQEYNLELQYRKPFLDIWKEEKDDPELGPLSERMGVRARGAGPLLVSDDELEAADSLLMASNSLAQDAHADSMALDVAKLVSALGFVVYQLDTLDQPHDDVLKSIAPQVLRLQADATEVQKILAAYLDHGARFSAIPPLDPTLGGWISASFATTLEVQENINTPSKGQQDDTATAEDGDEWTLVSTDDDDFSDIGSEHESAVTLASECGEEKHATLNILLSKVEGHSSQIEEFLPIFKADYDMFIGEFLPSDPYLYDDPQHPRADVSQLRTLLYSLSDEIKSSQRVVLSRDTRNFPEDVQQQLRLLHATQARIISNLTELLTNNCSEWIESMLAGRTKFSDFCQLEDEGIEEFIEEYRTRNGGLDDEIQKWKENPPRPEQMATVSSELVYAIERWREEAEGLNWLLSGKRESSSI